MFVLLLLLSLSVMAYAFLCLPLFFALSFLPFLLLRTERIKREKQEVTNGDPLLHEGMYFYLCIIPSFWLARYGAWSPCCALTLAPCFFLSHMLIFNIFNRIGLCSKYPLPCRLFPLVFERIFVLISKHTGRKSAFLACSVACFSRVGQCSAKCSANNFHRKLFFVSLVLVLLGALFLFRLP